MHLFVLNLSVCVCLCASIFTPWGSNHSVLADHLRTFCQQLEYDYIFFLSGTCESLCVISVCLSGQAQHTAELVEDHSVEPEALSQSLFTGCIQRVEPTVCCYCALVHYSTPLVCFCRCVFMHSHHSLLGQVSAQSPG